MFKLARKLPSNSSKFGRDSLRVGTNGVWPVSTIVSPLYYMSPEDRRAKFVKLAPACHFDAGELAQHCQIGRRQLEHYFERDFGKAPQEWLEIRRMLAAAYLLLKTNASTKNLIKNVAHALGFVHAPAFTREFRKYFGMSPTEFLKQKALFSLEFAQG